MTLLLALYQVKFLAHAHSHNDYLRGRPLLDALENGFASVEADVFLVDGELRVGHDRKQLQPGKTLEKLYLDPLLERYDKQRDSVFPVPGQLLLLVDIKESGEAVYKVLKERLEKYRPMLTSLDNGVVHRAAVMVVLSGDRPVETLAAEQSRLAFIDGRLPDLEANTPWSLTPIVSADYMETFGTIGTNLSAEKKEKLAGIVAKAHAQRKRVRFWASPDNEAGWTMLRQADVDLINTDNVVGLAKFLRARRAIDK